MDKQEREEHGKGVRRPRSDAARRPRPQSGPASASAVNALHGSHSSYDAYREPLRSEHPSSAHDRSAERRPGDRYVDVRKLLLFPYSEFLMHNFFFKKILLEIDGDLSI